MTLEQSKISLNFEIDFKEFEKEFEQEKANKITVKFYTRDAKVLTQSFPAFFTIGEIRNALAKLFNIPTSIVSLQFREESISDEEILRYFQPDQYGILEFKLLSADPEFKIPIEKAYNDLTVPDILTIQIDRDGEIEDVVVEIVNKAIDKPYLGGYRDIQSGIKYHHSYSQTGPPPCKVPPEMKTHRDTQTYFTRNKKTEKEYSRATQMAAKGICIPNISDKILTPQPYETAEKREQRLDIEGKVKTIQRYFRSWILKQRLKELSEEYRERQRLEAEREERERKENDCRRKKDLINRVFPIYSEDFAILHAMVDRWKKSEISRISSLYCGPAKIAELRLLLEKEIDILQSIDRLKLKVRQDIEVDKVIQFFKSIGNPIEWNSEYKHLHISMDTLETQKGRIYFDIYQKLCDKNLSRDEKISMYLNIKDYLNSHYCQESREIIKLIDRICELLARGINEIKLKGLQKRIEALILHHFKLQKCNEGVTDHMKKIQLQQMSKNLFYCQRCQKLKTIENFTVHARLEKLKICKTCLCLDKAEEPWIDLSSYKFILKQIRNYERHHKGISSIAFILQDRDIYFLIRFIWHGHSALSECDDIYNLRFLRWNKNEEWSPWNCILLTVDEAKTHLRVKNLELIYEKEFHNHLFNKHALAKRHFRKLASYDRHFSKLHDLKLDDNYNSPIRYKTDTEESKDIEEQEKTNNSEENESNGNNNEYHN